MDLSIPLEPKLRERLQKTLEENADWRDDCKVWTRYCHGGRGQISIGGRTYKVPRVAYAVYVGPIPRDLVVLHACDNPSCFLIEHLSIGPQRENIRDMFTKGRGHDRRVKGKFAKKSDRS